jgi:AcrR family transcriptional regulator
MAVAVSEDVLQAARRLAAEGRLRTATMEELAREAGVSRVTLYRRGATRAAIVGALRERLAQEERDALWPALNADGTARERLQAALVLLCETSEASMDVIEELDAAVRDELYHEPGDEALTRPEFTAPFRRLLLDGVVDGTLRPLDDVDEAATLLYNQVYWTYAHLRRRHRWSAERAGRAVVGMAMDGIRA